MRNRLWKPARCLAFADASLLGQIVTASLEGTILDPAGAVVPDAKVRVVNTSTNLEARTVTKGDGRFSFPSLLPGGPYTIAVEAAGFNTEERTGIVLQVNQAARIDFNLHIGAASETIKVN